MQIIYPILEPYGKLLGKQRRKAGKHYRLMNFVVRQEVERGTLLYHTMTKAMILLSKVEVALLDADAAAIPYLIEAWFVVPEDHDDRLLSRQMRAVGKMLEKPVTAITTYTIFTTTECNARCFYCFQKGSAGIAMTEDTAHRTADYIIRHCHGEKVTIHWFGGEPLYNKPVITQICQLLKEAGVEYKSTMITNGYLFDDEMIQEARDLWNLKRVQITLDGTEKMYNKIKAFIYKDENAYRRVLDNIHRLLEAGFHVKVRLNIDMYNADDLYQLVEELHHEFDGDKRPGVYLHTLFGEVAKQVAFTDDVKRKVLFEKIKAIKERLKMYGLATKPGLSRRVVLNHCIADNDKCLDIHADGHIGKCDNYLGREYIGHIDNEQLDQAVIDSFKECRDEIEACATCVDYPNCVRLKKCDSAQYCYEEMREETLSRIRQGMQNAYEKFLKGQKESDEDEIKD